MKLNFTPNASHHQLSIILRSESLSSLLMYIIVLSANKLIASFSLTPGKWKPLIWSDVHIMQARGSIPMLKRKQESRLPCCTLHLTELGMLSSLFIATMV